jgi:hypothetical protein
MLVWLIATVASCDAPPAPLSAGPPPDDQSLAVRRLQPHVWLSLGPHSVGNLGCAGDEIAWTTSARDISKQNSRNDVVKVASLSTPAPRVVATAKHGGTLTDALPMTGSWIVYLEYQQHNQSSRVEFWYLSAVDWSGGQVIGLANATEGPALDELPWYDAADGRVVWNQLDSVGLPILKMFDFSTRKSVTVPLPAAMIPVEPTLSANSVVFVDNSTDPARANEDFFGRRGTLRKFDVATHKLTTLSADPSAWMPRARGDEVVWTAISSDGSARISAVHLEGGESTTFGSNPVAPSTDGAVTVWYDSQELHFMEYGLASHHVVELLVGSWPDIRSVFAFCGKRVFFALPPAVDGGMSSIRYVNMPAGQP